MSRPDIKIVLSYRRDDAPGTTGRIFDRLTQHYGDDSVFMDDVNIPYGVDFHDHIHKVLNGCSALVAIIGPHWIGPRRGKPPRITDKNDWVRIEVETALQRKIPVVPVLVEDASIPQRGQLPETLQPLPRRNAASVGRGRDFHAHVEQLIRSLDCLLPATKKPVPDTPEEYPMKPSLTMPETQYPKAPRNTGLVPLRNRETGKTTMFYTVDVREILAQPNTPYELVTVPGKRDAVSRVIRTSRVSKKRTTQHSIARSPRRRRASSRSIRTSGPR